MNDLSQITQILAFDPHNDGYSRFERAQARAAERVISEYAGSVCKENNVELRKRPSVSVEAFTSNSESIIIRIRIRLRIRKTDDSYDPQIIITPRIKFTIKTREWTCDKRVPLTVSLWPTHTHKRMIETGEMISDAIYRTFGIYDTR